MTIKASPSNWDPLFWPLFVGGFVPPFAGNWSLPKWIVCAAVGATLGGGVAFLLDK